MQNVAPTSAPFPTTQCHGAAMHCSGQTLADIKQHCRPSLQKKNSPNHAFVPTRTMHSTSCVLSVQQSAVMKPHGPKVQCRRRKQFLNHPHHTNNVWDRYQH
jgi:hypothetical protein